MGTTSGGVKWETNGTPINEVSALNIDARIGEAAASGQAAAEAAVAPVQSQVTSLSAQVALLAGGVKVQRDSATGDCYVEG